MSHSKRHLDIETKHLLTFEFPPHLRCNKDLLQTIYLIASLDRVYHFFF